MEFTKTTIALLVIAFVVGCVSAFPGGRGKGGLNGGGRKPKGPGGPRGIPGVCSVVDSSGTAVVTRNCTMTGASCGSAFTVSDSSRQYDVSLCESASMLGKPCNILVNTTFSITSQCLFGSCDQNEQELVTRCGNFTATFCSGESTSAARLAGHACAIDSMDLHNCSDASGQTTCPRTDPVTVTGPSGASVQVFFCNNTMFFEALTSDQQMGDGRKHDSSSEEDDNDDDSDKEKRLLDHLICGKSTDGSHGGKSQSSEEDRPARPPPSQGQRRGGRGGGHHG